MLGCRYGGGGPRRPCGRGGAEGGVGVVGGGEGGGLAELRLQATEDHIDADLHLGRHGELIAGLRQLTEAEPLRERLHELLMLALYRACRPADALETY